MQCTGVSRLRGLPTLQASKRKLLQLVKETFVTPSVAHLKILPWEATSGCARLHLPLLLLEMFVELIKIHTMR